MEEDNEESYNSEIEEKKIQKQLRKHPTEKEDEKEVVP